MKFRVINNHKKAQRENPCTGNFLIVESTNSQDEVFCVGGSGWRWRQNWPPKRRFRTTALQGVTVQKISTWNITLWKCQNSQ